MQINETHDPALASWVASAQAPGCDFPIQNLPFAVFRRSAGGEPWRGGVAIGDQVIDLLALGCYAALAEGIEPIVAAAGQGSLNAFMALGSAAWSALRLRLSRTLRVGTDESLKALMCQCLVPQADVVFDVPAQIGDYTDFYSSVHHAINVGRLFRPDNPLMENYRWVPIGYHGRASSIGVSGQNVRRPLGQLKAAGADPVLAPCSRLDYELEMGIFIGPGNPLGEPVSIDKAESYIFGLCLLNDWSARDIQAWEYQPLGPFLGKNFGSTLSPWIITLEALSPYRSALLRDVGEPEPLPYLRSSDPEFRGALDVHLRVAVQTTAMREASIGFETITQSNYRHAYWTMSQLVTHHTIGGCNLRPGDLLGTGTLSGPTASEAGALLELTVGGRQPLTLSNGETRTFLLDGDAVRLTAWCDHPDFVRIGFGECTATVQASLGGIENSSDKEPAASTVGVN